MKNDAFSQFIDSIDVAQPNQLDIQKQPVALEPFEQFLVNISTKSVSNQELIDVLNQNPDFLNKTNSAGFNALLYTGIAASDNSQRAEFAEFLILKGADIHQKSNEFGWNALLCHISSPKIVSLLLQKGANPNEFLQESGLTPLTAACTRGLTDIATKLMDNGAVLFPTKSSWNPLLAACAQDDLALFKILLNKASVQDLECAFEHIVTPLHMAAKRGNLDAIKEMEKIKNLNVNARNQLGNTPLHLAAKEGFQEVCEYLLEKGANSGIENKEKKIPVELTKNSKIVELLNANPVARLANLSPQQKTKNIDDIATPENKPKARKKNKI